MGCQPPYQTLTGSENLLNNIISPIAFLISIYSCTMSFLNCRKIKISDPFVNLVLYIAIWDFIFSAIHFAQLYLTIDALCTVQQWLSCIIFNFSLSCNTIISTLSYGRTRAQQDKIMMSYKKWLTYLYGIVVLNAIFYFCISHHMSILVQRLAFTLLPTILVIIICIGNMNVIYILRKYNLSLENYAPVYLSMITVFVWGQATAINFLKDTTTLFYQIMLMLVIVLGMLMGFFNYAVSNKRIKEILFLSRDRSDSLSIATSSIYNDLERNLAI